MSNEHTPSDDDVQSDERVQRTLENQTIDGVDALVATDPGEIFIDLPAWNPRYIRVREGDRIQQGDVGTQSTREMAGPRLTHWVVDSITEQTVTGRNTDTEETTTWDREQVVQRLGTGSFSAVLSSFDRVSVTELDEWRGRHSTEEDEERRPYVVVTVYGNNGEKFTRLYAAQTAGDWDSLEMVQEGATVKKFDDDTLSAFEDAVRNALRAERRLH